MKQAQMSSMDMVFAFMIIMGVIAFFLIMAIRTLNNAAEVHEVDKLLVYRTLITKTSENSSIFFLNSSKIDLIKFNRFGNISEINKTRFYDHFFSGAGSYYIPDVCIFILNESYDFIHASGTRYAYGLVSNTTDFASGDFESCQNLIERDETPCQFYRHSEAMTKAAYVNETYVTFNILFCHP